MQNGCSRRSFFKRQRLRITETITQHATNMTRPGTRNNNPCIINMNHRKRTASTRRTKTGSCLLSRVTRMEQTRKQLFTSAPNHGADRHKGKTGEITQVISTHKIHKKGIRHNISQHTNTYFLYFPPKPEDFLPEEPEP
nr:hypothetical protein UBOKPTEZ_UBOKPTEZ_CDS_0002 [Microvirus sp.]